MNHEVFHRYILYRLLDEVILMYNNLAKQTATECGVRITRRTVENFPRSGGWCVVTWYAD